MPAQLVVGRPRPLGTLPVSRLVPTLRRRAVGPFVFLDHLGPIDVPPGAGFDVPPHPHIGLSTVTYLFAGEQIHRDSLGSEAMIRAGDVGLMTAGRGVVHSERAAPAWRARGGALHGAQLWLGLPAAHEEDAPSFAHAAAATVPAIAPAPGVRGRVLLGAAFGAAAPGALGAHPSRPVMIDLALDAGATIALPRAAAPEAGIDLAILVAVGAVALDDVAVGADTLAVPAAGDAAVLRATAASRVLVLGGPPLDGPRHLDWNFVSSRVERLARARDEWKAGAFPPIPGDDAERVPYPDGRSPR